MTVREDVVPTGEHTPDRDADAGRIASLREFRGRLPSDFRFDREFANERKVEAPSPR